MTNIDTQKMIDNAESFVATFHRAGSLIPKNQRLRTIGKDTKVSEALRIMEENHFSQLPVMAGRTLLGVFSYRSFALGARKQRSQRNKVLVDLPVEEFMEDFPYVAASEDWTKIQRQLDEKDGFFVGEPEIIDGLVTTMDVYQYFRRIADPFIQIAEIEVPLRRIVADKIPMDAQAEIFGRVLRGSYPEGKTPERAVDLTLNDLVLIVTSREYYGYFQDVLGKGDERRNTASQKLKDIPNLRNDVFHFRRELKQYELDKLIDCRNWLHRCIRAYEGERKGQKQHVETAGTDVKNTDIQRSRRKSPATAGQRVVSDEATVAKWSLPVQSAYHKFRERLIHLEQDSIKIEPKPAAISFRKQVPDMKNSIYLCSFEPDRGRGTSGTISIRKPSLQAFLDLEAVVRDIEYDLPKGTTISNKGKWLTIWFEPTPELAMSMADLIHHHIGVPLANK